MNEIGHAVVQGIQVLAEVIREQEVASNDVQHVLFVLRGAQVGVQEVVANRMGCQLQFIRAKRANGLNDVGSNGLQQHDRLGPSAPRARLKGLVG